MSAGPPGTGRPRRPTRRARPALPRGRACGAPRTIADEFHAVALAHPDRTRSSRRTARLTYRELDERTDALAAGLAGLGPGDRATRCCSRSPTGSTTSSPGTACSRRGWCRSARWPRTAGTRSARSAAASARSRTWSRPVPGSTWSASPSQQQRDHPTLRHVLVAGRPTIDPRVALDTLGAGHRPGAGPRDRRAGSRPAIDPDDVAVFQLSGGTTGVPKVIPRLHAEYWYNAAEYARSWGWTPDTRVAHLIPIIHNAGHRLRGARPAQRRRVPGARPARTSTPRCRCMAARAGHPRPARDTATSARPTTPASPRRARLAEAGRAVRDEGARPGCSTRWSGAGCGPGSCSAWGRGCSSPRGPARRGGPAPTTVGTPLSPLDEVRMLEPGTEDERARRARSASCAAAARTPCAATSTRPSTTRARSPPTASTAPATSPRSSLIDGERHVSIEGRIKDLINRGGEKINAEEVELLLLRHPRDRRGGRRRHARPAPGRAHLRVTSWSTASRSRWPRCSSTSPAAASVAEVQQVARARRDTVRRDRRARQGREDRQEASPGPPSRRRRAVAAPGGPRAAPGGSTAVQEDVMTVTHRVGLVVPSSNVTVETEVPALLARHAGRGSPSTPAGCGCTRCPRRSCGR